MEGGSITLEMTGDNSQPRIYTLKSGKLEAKITEWGATIMSLMVPDAKGNVADVVLGFDTVAPYMDGESSPYFGAIVGRVANRIAGASFTLNGKTYKLNANDGPNTLHGGLIGFDKVRWQSKEVKDSRGPSVKFTYHSKDGEEGFPGDLEVSVTYTISESLELYTEMEAKVGSKATPVNLANHTYWNLSGEDSGDILDHKVQIWASQITAVNDLFIPTGQFLSAKGTPWDFSEEHSIRSRIDKVPGPAPGGYDHNYVLEGTLDKVEGSTVDVRRAARVVDPASGRAMEVFTNAPGVQFYTGNFLEHTVGKGGKVYRKHSAFCFETQGFPNSVNQPNFPSIIVQPGKTYTHVMVNRFFTDSGPESN
ncbi:unnamed protein product [Calypogeia fissa]